MRQTMRPPFAPPNRAAAPASGQDRARRRPHADGRCSTSSATPASAYDPHHPLFRRDRNAIYARLRREAPVHYNERLQAWIVTRYDDVVAILLDNERFSAVNSIGI